MTEFLLGNDNNPRRKDGLNYIDIERATHMSKELQERADKIMKELQDSLTPLKEEIRKLKKGRE